VDLDLAAMPADADVPETARLFAESAGRFLVEVAPENRQAFLDLFTDLPAGEVGKVTGTGRVVIRGQAGTVIDLAIDEAKAAWQSTFDW